MFAQRLRLTSNKTQKLRITGPLWGESTGDWQGWGDYYSGTRLAQNDKHEYTKNIVLEYYSSTDFPVLVLVCWVLAPALVTGWLLH